MREIGDVWYLLSNYLYLTSTLFSFHFSITLESLDVFLSPYVLSIFTCCNVTDFQASPVVFFSCFSF